MPEANADDVPKEGVRATVVVAMAAMAATPTRRIVDFFGMLNIFWLGPGP